MKKRRSPLPEHFDSLEQAAEFWDTHDSADYEEFMSDVEFEVDIVKIYDEEETVISRRARVAEEPTVAEEPPAAGAHAGAGVAPELSLFLPVLNEEPNLKLLHAKIDEALAALGRTAEIIYVDDGSTDGGLEVLRSLAALDPRVRVIALRRNYGQTAAMAAGIDAARGQVLIPMDADLQNDPADIVRLLAKLEEGFDVVSGWRKERQDRMVSRKIPSMIANRIISFIGGVKLHDYGCSLKAYRREFLKEVKLYGEMHRFIPIYASWVGARVTEIPVRHYRRTMGRSKYGLTRTFKVMLDLMTIKFMASYHTKPIYVFGTFGFSSFLISIIAGVWALVRKLDGESFIRNPLLTISIVMFAVGVQFILMGLLAEMLIRTYHESQAKSVYAVRERIGFKDDDR
jgi:glycosyltransferase involved in cell wall biosynthesis